MNLTNNHFSLDLETLGWCDTASVTSLAITPFNFKADKNVTFDELLDRTYYAKLEQRSQLLGLKRIVNPDTVAFWKKQSAQLRGMSVVPASTDRDLKTVLFDEIPAFLKSNDYSKYDSYIFERGMGFDSSKLDTLYRQLGEPETNNRIINYWRFREIRTMNDILGNVSNGKWEVEGGRPDNFIEHHARHDAAMDALRMIKLVNVAYSL